jgi:hypothetical protein
MLSITVSGVNTIGRELDQSLARLVKQIADDVYITAKKNTPVRSGNARKNWTEKVTRNNFSVENHVPYIERLDKGYSKKAPNGITMPTITTIRGKYK